MFLENVKNAFVAPTVTDESDRGDLVQTILIVAGFAIVSVAAIAWISTAIFNKAADTANCIENAGTYASTSSTAEKCKETHKDKGGENAKSFTKDDAYTGRYGG